MTVIPLTDPIWGLFWKISSFQNNPGGVMSTESTSLQTVPQLPADPAQKLVPSADIAIPLQAPAKKDLIRRALMAGAAVALLATASWYGWDYWTVGRFLVSTDDAYVKADTTTVAPK